MDQRWNQLGELLVRHSTGVQPGERVMIALGEVETYPLVQAVYRACIQAGAYPQVQFLSEELNRQVLKYGSAEQVGWIPEIEAYGMEWADVYIGLRGAYNLDVVWDIPAEQAGALPQGDGADIHPALAENALVPGARAERGAGSTGGHGRGDDHQHVSSTPVSWIGPQAGAGMAAPGLRS